MPSGWPASSNGLGEKVTAMSLPQDPRTRRFVSWLALGVAGAEVIVAAVSTAAYQSEPYSPGWLGFAFELPAFARRPLST